MGLSTGNRNGAAAILVAGLNFAGTDTLPFLLVGVIVMLLVLLPAAKVLGRGTRRRQRRRCKHSRLIEFKVDSTSDAGHRPAESVISCWIWFRLVSEASRRHHSFVQRRLTWPKQ